MTLGFGRAAPELTVEAYVRDGERVDGFAGSNAACLREQFVGALPSAA